jgi:6-phosphogluconolactonase
MLVHEFKTVDELSLAVAEWMTGYISKVLEKQDRFTIALSGGSTPQKLHKVLASDAFKKKIDWSRMHVFWGDERAVPFEDERNNAKMAYDTLLNEVPVPASQIHVMRTDIDPEQSAKEYESLLKNYFSISSKTFDLVLLGMGDDGHTLSLFPGTEIIHEQSAWVKSFYLAAQSMYRISLTAPVVNHASAVLFLATGSKKAGVLKEVLKGSYNPDTYPSQIIQPTSGQLHWFVDEAAASALGE